MGLGVKFECLKFLGTETWLFILCFLSLHFKARTLVLRQFFYFTRQHDNWEKETLGSTILGSWIPLKISFPRHFAKQGHVISDLIFIHMAICMRTEQIIHLVAGATFDAPGHRVRLVESNPNLWLFSYFWGKRRMVKRAIFAKISSTWWTRIGFVKCIVFWWNSTPPSK